MSADGLKVAGVPQILLEVCQICFKLVYNITK